MAISVSIPTALRNRCAGASMLKVSASSVRAALERLERDHAELYCCVCNETGAVRQHVNLFVNADNVRDLEGFDTPLGTGDVLTIMIAVSGG